MGKTMRLDATGLKCPIPVLRTKKALHGMMPDDILEVACTDPMAEIDIPSLLFKTGDELIDIVVSGGVITLRIRKM